MRACGALPLAIVLLAAPAAGQLTGETFPLPKKPKIKGCIDPGSAHNYTFDVKRGWRELRLGLKEKKNKDLGFVKKLDSRVFLLAPAPGPVKGVPKKKKAKGTALFQVGEYVLRIEDFSGDGGCYKGKVLLKKADNGRGGSKLRNECVDPGTERLIPFQGKAGLKLRAKVKGAKAKGVDQGKLSPTLRLVAPSGFEVDFGSGNRKVKGSSRLQETGQYELYIGSTDGEGGCYRGRMKLR